MNYGTHIQDQRVKQLRLPPSVRHEGIMNTMTLFLVSLAFSATSAADSTRLKLWVTDAIDAINGNQCNLTTSLTASSSLPVTHPTLTEQDVTAWNADNGRWTLNPARFSSSDVRQKLQDHCFVLAIDSKMISSGIVLSSHSARLTGFPTISLIDNNNTLDLQLTSSNHGSHMRLIHVDVLNAMLGQHPEPLHPTNR